MPLAIELGPRNQVQRPVDLEPSLRVATTTCRIPRDTVASRPLKVEHDFSGQLCGTTIVLPGGTRYAEAHHVRPLGRPHDGPDVRENMVVLCPNLQAMCDCGAIRLDADRLRSVHGHKVDPSFIAYHNDGSRGPAASESQSS